MSNTTDWAAIAQKLHQDCRALEGKLTEVTKQRDYAHQKCSEYRIVALGAEDGLEKMTAQRDAFRDELSKVMPLDYKDWWENDKNEWPIVARLTIESKKRLIDMDRETIERMERKLAEVTQQRDEWKELYERLNESLASNKRLFSNKLAEKVIDGQVKRIKFLEDKYSETQKELLELKGGES